MNVWDYLVVLITSLLVLLFFMYMFWRVTATRDRERPAEIFTLVRCGDGTEKKRRYQEGDYVGKQTAECEGGVIIGIFKEAPLQT
ncbi:conserved hypothetical protein [Pyrobaculum islandicum DSM 4184]|uniref:Uncharacterized protein n=1 Tax=Pyrobaculum islandicum (strain DSM 4184 / JCM 9189 / GEO3) TaxID=384616 RepID=A1RRH2_PYRIL|nr:hypothetical protein [Pyrobaculum islandicum]ABL87554.1 conserved hypothetical protein [Pyrobaculum islandicum DSM 4184]